MVPTNYECWANNEGVNSFCDIQPVQLRPQVDLFNPRAMSTRSVAQPKNGSSEIYPKTVSHISSNGYYGFTNVNSMDKNISDGVNSCTNYEARRSYNDSNFVGQIKTFDNEKVHTSRILKRLLSDGNTADKLAMHKKRCRLDSKLEAINISSFAESNNMDVDIAEFDKDARALREPYTRQRVPNHNIPTSNNIKNTFEKITAKELKRAQIFTTKVSSFHCNINSEACRNLCVHEHNLSGIKEGIKLNKEIISYEENKRSEIDELLEEMFSETHGSGCFLLTEY